MPFPSVFRCTPPLGSRHEPGSRKQKGLKKTISATRMKRQFCRIQSLKFIPFSFSQYNKTEKRIRNPRLTSTPPRSFCRTPSEHNSQKTNPQISKLIGRINAYPATTKTGKNRKAIGNENTPINVITKYQLRNDKDIFQLYLISLINHLVNDSIQLPVNLFPVNSIIIDRILTNHFQGNKPVPAVPI